MSTLSPLRVASSGRYFETFEGAPFLFVGFNDALDWPGLQGLYRRRDVAAADQYLQEVAASGVTVLRLMLEYVHHDGRSFEKPVGRFNPVMVQFWDDLFRLCEEHGLRVLLAPWDNFWMARQWHRHPYNAANGGPAAGPHAFFTDPAVLAATKARLQFVIRRWGGSGVLAAWDLFNEIHPYWGGTPSEQAEVIRLLSQSVRETEEETWGFTRPQTVSLFGPEPSPEYEDLIFHHPSLDFATTHIYQGAIDDPKDTVAPARTMARWVRYAQDRLRARGTVRPFFDTEHGPIHLFNDHGRFLPEPFDDEYERHLMWAHLAQGGAGSGMRWPARHPHLTTPGMRQALGSLAGFARMVDWQRFQPQAWADTKRIAAPNTATSATTVGAATKRETVYRFGCQDDTQAIVWVLRGVPSGHQGVLPTREPLPGITVALTGMSAGQYVVRFWNTQVGQEVIGASAATASGGKLTICLPPLASDMALAVTRQQTEKDILA